MDRTPVPLKNFRIVILCGSSGFLLPCLEILRTMPRDTGMAFVVLTHRRSGSVDRLVRVLSWSTDMPVREIEDLSVLLPNRIYVMPPGKDVTTDGTLFRLVPMSVPRGMPNRFDIFLNSLAKNSRNRAVTVILSGLGADGSAALQDLGLNGGLAFAQSDADCGDMPASAVATGKVDFFCSAADIGVLVAALEPALSADGMDRDSRLAEL